MKFDQEKFIVRHGPAAFGSLKDFLSAENEEILEEVRNFVMNENLKSFVYEGNKYTIEKVSDGSRIWVIDQVAEENGAPREQTRCMLDLREFSEILAARQELVPVEKGEKENADQRKRL